MNKLNRLIRDYFGFSATELRGFWVLFLLAILLLSIPAIVKKGLQNSYSNAPTPADVAKVDSLIALLENPQPEENSPNLTQTETNYLAFDPNDTSEKVLMQNGIPDWLAKRIIKYRSKGGKFRIKTDLLKIYGFSDDLYAELEEYIRLPEKQTYQKQSEKAVAYTTSYSPSSKSTYRKKKELEAVDINLADTVQLQKIPGVGPVLSARITRFRDKLGGLHSATQLQEVYQISEFAIQNLQKYTYISEEYATSKLRINTDDVASLAQHPYISYALARAIVNHRKNYGDYAEISDCKEVYLMKDSIFYKIAPYLGL